MQAEDLPAPAFLFLSFFLKYIYSFLGLLAHNAMPVVPQGITISNALVNVNHQPRPVEIHGPNP